jgi:alcohol dehydrogenase class IV
MSRGARHGIPPFEFATAGRIRFGAGCAAEAAADLASWGRAAMVFTGRRAERARPVIDELERRGVRVYLTAVEREPRIEDAVRAAEEMRARACDFAAAVGGGSAIDAGKAAAALAANPGDPLTYLEVIGEGRPIERRPLPFAAFPTTAGTGAEVTRNAVLKSDEHGVKVSMRHPWMLPALAAVDPELTADMPPAVTAATGMDALTQLLEAFVSPRANPMTDAFCRRGLALAAGALRGAWSNGANRRAREEMALASLFGGLALANAGLGAVHGLAGPLGGAAEASHGAVCAALLPSVCAANVKALRARDPAPGALARYEEAAALVTGDARATPEDGIHWLKALCRDLRIPPLGELGVDEGLLEAVAERADRSSSMKANPIVLTRDELIGALRAASRAGF